MRKALYNRFGIKHRNIIDILGIDSRFTPHPGLVLEYCTDRDLLVVCTGEPLEMTWIYVCSKYCKKHNVDIDSTVRPSSTPANAYSLVCSVFGSVIQSELIVFGKILDILKGLRYMHTFPVPIPQGDLVPVRLSALSFSSSVN
jgi:hypothetical protein